MRSPRAALYLRLAVSLGLIALVIYLFRDRWREVAANLLRAHPWLLALGVLLFLIAMVINALKWWVLLRAQEIAIPFRAVLNYTFVGFFFNNLLPANIGGDVMRGVGVAYHTERAAQAAASVVLDRIIGLSAYMSVAALASGITVFVTGRSDLQVLVLVAVVATAALAVVAAVLLSRRVRALVGRVIAATPLRPLHAIWESLSTAFEAYRYRYRSLLLAYGIGLGGILSTSWVNFVLSESLGGGISLLHILLFTPLTALVLIIPISIGGLGLNQVAYPFFYGLVGTPAPHALALSLFIQATQVLCSLPGGLLWLRWRREKR